MKNVFGLFLLMFVLLCSSSVQVVAADDDIYDSLQESIEDSWNEGMDELKNLDSIPMKGPLSERILRGIANVFYKHMSSIKGWSLFIGILSVGIGVFIAVTAKLNKKMRRFAITCFIITIPSLLIFMVFGIAKLVSMFMV
ncbi:MAG: hypothetical protein IJA54_04340 [Tyzzerella sp.]|nr:hypothetical protein [Tyzzerella sp.]